MVQAQDLAVCFLVKKILLIGLNVEKIMSFKIRLNIPIWQRCFFGCVSAFGSWGLLLLFVDGFIVSSTPPPLSLIAHLLGLSFCLSLFARVAAKGKLFEPTPDGRISVWLRAGFGFGAAISLAGEARILISVINGEMPLRAKDGIYLAFLVILTCLFAYVAIRGKLFAHTTLKSATAVTDTPADSAPPSKPTT
jgi:hypothetical protein